LALSNEQKTANHGYFVAVFQWENTPKQPVVGVYILLKTFHPQA